MSVKAHLLQTECERKPALAYNENRDEYADCLRQNGSDCRSCSAQMKYGHKQQVAEYVEYTRDCDGDERHVRVADAAENAAENVVRGNKDSSCTADADVCCRLTECLRRRMHQACERFGTEYRADGEYCRYDKKEADAAADCSARIVRIIPSDCLSDKNGDAHGKPGYSIGKCCHKHAAGCDAGDIGSRCELSDDEQIDTAVHCLQKECKQNG